MPLIPLCIFFLLLQKHIVTTKTNALKLPLIHPESPESPLPYLNLSDDEKLRKLIHQSHARHEENHESIRPHVSVQSPYYYMVKIGIGTFKTKPLNQSYYLYMDTGSDLLWLQCEGCKSPSGRCFPQNDPVYPNTRSGSYRPLLCNKHKLCEPNQFSNGFCSYKISYMDSSSSSGVLASETFAFGHAQVLENLVFGCGIDNNKNYGYINNQIAEIMGLGRGSHSILNQAISQTLGTFSYCLPAINKYSQKWPNTYLRFGTDVVKRSNLRATPLLQNDQDSYYHVNLQGISINNKRLANISDKDFKLRPNGSGGCIIDSGTPFSRLIKPAYTVLEKALRSYFARLKAYKGPKGLGLCYERKKAIGHKNLPTMTLHFEGSADLVVKPESLFLVMDKISLGSGEYFCLAMVPSDFGTVIGSYQQTNQRFVYDTKQNLLLFGAEDCYKDV